MKKLFFYKIRVHCWGGLGSQLFAWAMAEQLKIKFPSKDIQIILHNSGVTRRESAIGFLSNKFIITNVNDYALPKNLGTSLSSKNLKLRIFAKSVLDRLGFVIYSSNLKTIAKVKPWTLVLRGHYAHDTVPVSILQSIIPHPQVEACSRFHFLFHILYHNLGIAFILRQSICVREEGEGL